MVVVVVVVAVVVSFDASAFRGLVRNVLDRGLSGTVTATLGFDDGTLAEETLPVPGPVPLPLMLLVAVGGNRGGGNGRL